MKTKKWVEIWIDSGSKNDFIYLLILRSFVEGHLEIVDPQKNGEVIENFAKYEDALHWLNEDEYDLVEGRWEIEE